MEPTLVSWCSGMFVVLHLWGGQTLTKLTYDGDGCPDHSVSLLEPIGAHGDERVCNRGRKKRCIDSNDLGGVVEKENTIQNRKQEARV